MNSNVKTAVFWVVLICVAVLLWTVVRTSRTGTETAIVVHSVPEGSGRAEGQRSHHHGK